MTVGLEQDGEMCVLTARGAMRVEPQFSDQSMIVPQGGTVSLAGGQIESLQADASACSCDFPRAHMEAPKSAPPPHSQPVLRCRSSRSPAAAATQENRQFPPPSASAGEPVYTVLMPPLSFDANSPEPPPDPAPGNDSARARSAAAPVRRISRACEPRAFADRRGSRFAAGANPGRRSARGTATGHLRPRKEFLPQADGQRPLRRRRLQQLERMSLFVTKFIDASFALWYLPPHSPGIHAIRRSLCPARCICILGSACRAARSPRHAMDDRANSPRMLLIASLLLCVICTSCGAVGSGPAPPPPVTVTVTPNSAQPFPGGNVQFNAVVENASSSAVNWQVNQTAGGNPDCGDD